MLASVLVLGAVGVLVPGRAALADGAKGDYAFAEGARRVDGAASTADAVLLETGRSYRSTLPPAGSVHYGLELDGTSDAYVSVTAVPPTGGTVSVADGVKVSLRDANGRSCDADTAIFGAGGSPHPLAAWAVREISPRRSLCQGAGTYYVTVERAAPDGRGASPDPWELELTTVSEPRPANGGATNAPEEWNSATPGPAKGQEVRRPGGAGFAHAAPLGEGVWRDDIRPGRTLFYRVPVDWGQQLHVTAELGSTDSTGSGFVASALDLDLYNPVRGPVADLGIGYGGSQKADSLAALPPVEYANRHTANGRSAAMRFAGSYYLVAHLSAKVADEFGDGPVPLKLRVRVSGRAHDGPGYQGTPVPADAFTVTEEDREAADEGTAAGDDSAMKALAVGGIGTGTALLAVLGVWTAVARRRATA